MWKWMSAASVVSLATAITILGCSANNSPPDTAPKTPPPAGSASSRPTVEPQPIPLEELTGTLVVEARLPSLGEGWGELTGWFFIHGQLQGSLPCVKEIQIRPDSYEVLYIACYDHSRANRSWDNVDYWWNKVRFVTVSGPITIDAGKKTVCKLKVNEYPEGFRRQFSKEFPYKAPRVCFGLDDDPEPIRKQIQDAWDDFLDSKEGMPLVQLQQTQAFRKRVWMNLPEHLGGPRYIDGAQLRLLGKWLSRYCQSRLPEFCPVAYLEGTPELLIKRVEAQTQSWHKQIREKVLSIETAANKIADAMDNAPEDR